MMMGDAFGKAFQYGKRKISAMSNEEFNAMTPDDLAREINTDYTAIIQTMPEAMAQSRDFQRLILIEMGKIIADIPDVLKEFFFGQHGLEPNEPPPAIVPGPGVIPPGAYDWGPTIASLLSGAGVAGTNFNTLKQTLENFFAPIFEFAQEQLDKAHDIVDEFIKDFVDPIIDPPEPPDPEPPDQPGVDPIDPIVIPGDPDVPGKFQEFLDTLTESDYSIGGHRHRNYKGTLMHWEVPNRWIWSNQGGKINKYEWTTTGWNLISQGHTNNSQAQTINKVNAHKNAIGAQLVMEFVLSGGQKRHYYFIKTEQH